MKIFNIKNNGMQTKPMRNHFHPSDKQKQKRMTISNIGADTRKTVLSYIVSGTVNYFSHLWKAIWQHTINLAIQILYDPIISLLII